MSKKWTVLGASFALIAVIALVQISGNADSDRLTGVAVPIEITAMPLPLDAKDPARQVVGKTRYAGGWILSSSAESFGGFSGLIIDAATESLLAISDKGEWWGAAFDPISGSPPAGGFMLPYESDAAAISKIDLDAESIIAYGSGVLVSFEQKHRLEYVSVPGEPAQPSAFMANVAFDGISKNGGMEAITILGDGQLLAIAERGLDHAGRLKAWLSSEVDTKTLFFKPPVNFAPTDAATLPNGDVLILLRQYSAINGVAIKVHHLRRSDIVPGAVLEGMEILHVTPKMSVDNMEGLDVVVRNDDTVRIVMISDDNFNALQRTLLMMFDYKYQ